MGGGRVKGKITPEKFILFETSYLSLQWWTMMTPWLLHMSTVKPLHANWAINTHNLIPQRPELIRSGFKKGGFSLITDTNNYVLTWLFIYTTCIRLLHTIPFFIKLFNKIFTSYCFVEDVNSWMRGTHEFHENWATTNSNDSTVCIYTEIYPNLKSISDLFKIWKVSILLY